MNRTWAQNMTKPFRSLRKNLLLAKYNSEHDTKIRSDSSKDECGHVLLQRKSQTHDYHPVYFASKTLTAAEQGYSTIKKEAGSITIACNKFDKYILGIYNLLTETDQKPLVTVLSKKLLGGLPPRIVRFRLSL